MIKFIAIISLSTALGAGGAMAQTYPQRLWVASFGDNSSSTCSYTAPCTSFERAAMIAPAGSEIDCIDTVPGIALNITKSITINCEGVSGGNGVKANPSSIGTAEISVSATDIVVLRGLQLNFQGFGTGIHFTGAGTLVLDKVHIGGAVAGGVYFTPTGSSKLIVTDSLIDSNGSGATGAGIRVVPSGTGSAEVTLERVTAVGNVFGIALDGSGSTGGINATIRDSVASSNRQDGIIAVSASGNAPIGLLVTNSASVNNVFGIRSIGPGVTVRVNNSEIAGNNTGLATSSGGALLSYGNNKDDANGVNGTFTGVVAQK